MVVVGVARRRVLLLLLGVLLLLLGVLLLLLLLLLLLCCLHEALTLLLLLLRLQLAGVLPRGPQLLLLVNGQLQRIIALCQDVRLLRACARGCGDVVHMCLACEQHTQQAEHAQTHTCSGHARTPLRRTT
jgi:hypothetical protein